MPDWIGELLVLSTGVAFSPIPIAAVILVMLTPGGIRNGCSYLAGWALGLALLIGAITVFAAGAEANEAAERRFAGAWVSLGFGIFLILMSLRSWMKRPRSGSMAETPEWMKQLDRFRLGKSLGLGALLGVVNLKNIPLSVQASLLLARTCETSMERALVIGGFIFVASTGVALPIGVALLGGARTEDILQRWKGWLRQHNAVILTFLFAAIGSWLILKGLIVVLSRDASSLASRSI